MPSTSAAALLDYFEGRRLLDRPDTNSDADDAIAAFQRALAVDPHFVMAVTSLSEAYLLRYQETRDAAWLSTATQTAEQALTLDATDASAHVALAKVQHQIGLIDEAIRELRLAVQLVPDSDDAHRLLGRYLAENGKTGEGILELERAISLRPGFWTNHYTLGFVRYREGRYQDAIPSFLRVLELQPNYAPGYVILGASYHRAGQIDLAIGNYEHAARIGQDPDAYANLGQLYFIDRRFTAALESYRAALAKDPLSPVLWRDIGDVYSQQHLRADASTAYEKAISLAAKRLTVNPRDAAMIALLALCEAKLGRRTNAERHASEALALTRNDRDVLFSRAATYAILNRRDKALDALRSALQNGYEPALARSDDDLETLRSSREFRQLVGEEPNGTGR
jgi:serine/threonine-protein kinase